MYWEYVAGALMCSGNQKYFSGTSLTLQWLRLCASTAAGMSSIPGWETKIPHDVQHNQKKEKKERKCFLIFLQKPGPKSTTVHPAPTLGPGGHSTHICWYSNPPLHG